jgi:hypothetical protein
MVSISLRQAVNLSLLRILESDMDMSLTPDREIWNRDTVSSDSMDSYNFLALWQ